MVGETTVLPPAAPAELPRPEVAARSTQCLESKWFIAMYRPDDFDHAVPTGKRKRQATVLRQSFGEAGVQIAPPPK